MPSGPGEVEWSGVQGLPGVRDTGSGSLGMKSHQLHGQGEAGDRALESPSVFRVAHVVWLQQRVCWAGSGEAEVVRLVRSWYSSSSKKCLEKRTGLSLRRILCLL